MRVHANAKLGPAGRLALVRLIEEGARSELRRRELVCRWPPRIAGGSAGGRFRGSARERRLGCGSQLAAAPLAAAAGRRSSSSAICDARDARISGRAGWPGCSAGLARRSGRCCPSRPLASARGAAPDVHALRMGQPGALLHMDVKRLRALCDARALGHRRPAQRAARATAAPAGSTLHVVVDDHSRPLRRATRPRRRRDHARTLERALAHFAGLGLRPPQAVMTDNAGLPARSASRRVLAAARRPAHHHRRPTHRAGTARPSA